MGKVIKYFFSFLSFLIVLLLALPVTLALVLNIDAVQNSIARRTVSYASSVTGTTVSIGDIRIQGYNTFTGKDIYVEDCRGDTLLYVGDLKAKISLRDMMAGRVRLTRANLDSVKVFLYQPEEGEVNITEVIDRFVDPDSGSSQGKPIIFENATISNAEFRYYSDRDRKEVPPAMIDFLDMRFRDLNVKSERLVIDGDALFFENMSLAFVDKSGFRMDSFTSDNFEIVGSRLIFANTRICTGDSDIRMMLLLLNADAWSDYGDYNDCVPMKLRFSNARMSATTLSYFVPWLNRNSDILLSNINATFNGTINDFWGEIESLGNSRLAISGTYAMRDITDNDKALMDITLDKLSADGEETVRLLGELKEIVSFDLNDATAGLLRRIGKYDFSGSLKGGYDSFVVNGGVIAGIGAAAVDMSFGFFPGETTLNGAFTGETIDAGALLNVPLLGNISFEGKFDGRFEDDHNYLSGTADIQAVDINGDRYEKIFLNGTYAGDRFTGELISLDEDLNFSLEGEADLSGSVPVFDLGIFAKNIGLGRFGVKGERIGFTAKVSGTGSGLDDFNGNAFVKNVEISGQSETLHIDDITVTGKNDERSKYFSLLSPMIDIEYSGTADYGTVVNFFRNLPALYMPSLGDNRTAMCYTPADADEEGYSELNVDIKYSRELSGLLPEGFAISDNTFLDLRFNPYTNHISAVAKSDYIEYGTILMTRLGMSLNNDGDRDELRLNVYSEDILTETFAMPAMSVSAILRDDTVNVRAAISNRDTDIYADLKLNGDVRRDDNGILRFTTVIMPSTLYTIDRKWTVESEPIICSQGKVSIDGFTVSCGKESLSVDGIISGHKSDTLNVNLKDFDLSLLSNLLHVEGYDISGIANGYAKVVSVKDKAKFFSNLTFDGMDVNGSNLPSLHFRSLWDFAAEEVMFELKNSGSDKRLVGGRFNPQNRRYSLKTDIESIPVAFAEPLLNGMLTGTQGEMSLRLDVAGEKDRLKMDGEIVLSGVSSCMSVNNVSYAIPDAVIHINDNTVNADGIGITDHEGNRALFKASLNVGSLRNITYTASLTTDCIKILDITPKDNPVYYGEMYAKTNLKLNGNKMGINIGGDISTTNNSSLTAVLAGPSGIVNSDFITFRSKVRETAAEDRLTLKKMLYERMMRNSGNAQSVNLNINAGLSVGADTDITLIFDNAGDNRLNMNGGGTFNISYVPRRNEFNIYGSYDIDYGRFMFNLQNVIVDKMFILEPGGTIQWTGDPLDAMLNIKGIYSLKASLAPIATTTELERSGRIPVECVLTVNDRISQPEIKFDVNVATTDATVQNSVTSLLRTQEMIATQFFWLLAFNNFYPDNTYGQSESIGTMGTASIGFDYLTSQISNWISSDDLNVILRYKAHDMYNSDEIDVGLSKELLDNRLILEVEGNIDTGNNSVQVADNNRGNISGDASITWLINPAGNLRVKGFTRTIDRFDENQGLQENGVGIYYREDFNRLSDIAERYRRRKTERRKRRADRSATAIVAASVSETDGADGDESPQTD